MKRLPGRSFVGSVALVAGALAACATPTGDGDSQPVGAPVDSSRIDAVPTRYAAPGHCIDEGLARDRSLSGHVEMTAHLDRGGHVSRLRITSNRSLPDDVLACMRRACETATFDPGAPERDVSLSAGLP